MLPVLLLNNCSCSLRVGVRAFRVGGKGLGSVFFFFSCSGLGSAWSFPGGTCRSFRMGAVIGGCMSRDICPGICSGIAVSLSGGVIRRPIVMGWKKPESEPELKMCYPHEVIRDLGTFFSHIKKTNALTINA